MGWISLGGAGTMRYIKGGAEGETGFGETGYHLQIQISHSLDWIDGEFGK